MGCECSCFQLLFLWYPKHPPIRTTFFEVWQNEKGSCSWGTYWQFRLSTSWIHRISSRRFLIRFLQVIFMKEIIVCWLWEKYINFVFIHNYDNHNKTYTPNILQFSTVCFCLHTCPINTNGYDSSNWWSIGANGTIGTNRKAPYSNGSVGAYASN